MVADAYLAALAVAVFALTRVRSDLVHNALLEKTFGAGPLILRSIEDAVPLPTITLALYERFRSRMEDTFADRMLAMMRNQFGGHQVHTAETAPLRR